MTEQTFFVDTLNAQGEWVPVHRYLSEDAVLAQLKAAREDHPDRAFRAVYYDQTAPYGERLRDLERSGMWPIE